MVYFVEKRLWARITLVVLMVPIAVASNALRVVGAGVVTYFWGPQHAEGFFSFLSRLADFCFCRRVHAVRSLVPVSI